MTFTKKPAKSSTSTKASKEPSAEEPQSAGESGEGQEQPQEADKAPPEDSQPKDQPKAQEQPDGSESAERDAGGDLAKLRYALLSNVEDGEKDPDAYDEAKWKRSRRARPLSLEGDAPQPPKLADDGSISE